VGRATVDFDGGGGHGVSLYSRKTVSLAARTPWRKPIHS
jgi:hypothetical protein